MESVFTELDKGNISLPPTVTAASRERLRRYQSLSFEEKEATTKELCGLMRCDSIKESDDVATILVGLFSDRAGAWEPALLRIMMDHATGAVSDANPVQLIRYLGSLARIFEAGYEDATAELELELEKLQFPSLIFRCCRSPDVILQMLCMEMMVGLNKYPTFVARCVSPEFQSWLLGVCDIESGSSGAGMGRGIDSIASEALRVACSAVSSARRGRPPGRLGLAQVSKLASEEGTGAVAAAAATQTNVEDVAASFKERLCQFLSSRNEPFALTGMYCFVEYACSSPATIQEVMNSSVLVESLASCMRSGRLTIKQSYFECLVKIFEDPVIGVDDASTFTVYSKLSECLNKDLAECLVEVCKSSAQEVQLTALKLLRLVVARPWFLDFSRGLSAVLEYVLNIGTGNFSLIPHLQSVIDSLASNPRVDLLGKDTVKMLKSTRLSKSVFAAPETL